jgi:peptidyl-prolyl cis-trans isomerase A (cyclophilin A)
VPERFPKVGNMNRCTSFLKTGLLAVISLFVLTLSYSGFASELKQANSVVLVTDVGEIEIELYAEKAPLSVEDFLRYVDQGLYEGDGFYRVVRKDNDRGEPIIEAVQGGLLSEEGALPPIAHEDTSKTGILHKDGVVSLARGAPGTGSAAAFFICIGDQPSLDYGGLRNKDAQGFAAFGRVVKGMDVVRKIHVMRSDKPVESDYVRGQILPEPVKILKAYRNTQ